MSDANAAAELPIEGGQATKQNPPATAQAERTAAEAEVARLSKKRLDLLRQGADLDRGALARLDAELTATGERLGAADLVLQRAGTQMPFDVEKFCAQQTKASDLQQTDANRSVEFNEAHSHRNKLKAAIETFDASEDSRTLARKLERVGRGEKLNAEDLKIAREIAGLRERLIAAEFARTRAAAALAKVKARSHTETAVFESWREAVLRLPGGARMLQDLPKPHKPTDVRGLDPRGNLIGDSTWYTGPNAGTSAGAPGSAPAPSAPAPAAAASAPPAAGSPAAMWGRARAQTAAQHGMGPRADAFTPPVPIERLIATINSDPSSLGLLAARSDLTEEQRTAALRAMRPSRDSSGTQPPWARKAAKKTPAKAASKPRAKPALTEQSTPRRRGLFGLRPVQQRRI